MLGSMLDKNYAQNFRQFNHFRNTEYYKADITIKF